MNGTSAYDQTYELKRGDRASEVAVGPQHSTRVGMQEARVIEKERTRDSLAIVLSCESLFTIGILAYIWSFFCV